VVDVVRERVREFNVDLDGYDGGKRGEERETVI
jgi:hypothetical protein